MLKNTEFLYEGENFKIINPNRGLKVELNEKIQEYTDKDGNLDLENEDLKLYLLQTLISSDEDDFQFIDKTIEDIRDIEENPSIEYEGILYFIGSIVSDLIISNYRTKILELKQIQIDLLKHETLNVLDNINSDINIMDDKTPEKEEKVSKIKKIFSK